MKKTVWVRLPFVADEIVLSIKPTAKVIIQTTAQSISHAARRVKNPAQRSGETRSGEPSDAVEKEGAKAGGTGIPSMSEGIRPPEYGDTGQADEVLVGSVSIDWSTH
ncbi:MAG: hypothetical protein RR829_05905, partial [Oscillospiraceae bacterium]